VLRKIAERELDDSQRIQELCSHFGFTENDIAAAVVAQASSKPAASIEHEQVEVDES